VNRRKIIEAALRATTLADTEELQRMIAI